MLAEADYRGSVTQVSPIERYQNCDDRHARFRAIWG